MKFRGNANANFGLRKDKWHIFVIVLHEYTVHICFVWKWKRTRNDILKNISNSVNFACNIYVFIFFFWWDISFSGSSLTYLKKYIYLMHVMLSSVPALWPSNCKYALFYFMKFKKFPFWIKVRRTFKVVISQGDLKLASLLQFITFMSELHPSGALLIHWNTLAYEY